MKISAKTEYACKALLELTEHWPNAKPLQIQAIARKRQIPIKFLTQILIQLKQLGYVQSVRGQQGGYILTKAPREIKLSEILGEFAQWPLTPKINVRKGQSDILSLIWQQADQTLLEFLSHLDFAELSSREKGLDQIPMYTI